MCNPATATCYLFDLSVSQADVSASHLIIDVVGLLRSAREQYHGDPVQRSSTTDATISGTAEQFPWLVGNFTKLSATTGITTTWIRPLVNTVGTVGSSFCHYQASGSTGSSPNSGSFEPLEWTNYGDHQAVSWTDYWAGLTAGSHAITLWVRGNATSCAANFGNFQQTVVVKEE